jgi:hypothetical protein
MKMTNAKKFDALWHHVTKNCGHNPSPMMVQVGAAIRKAVLGLKNAKTFRYLEPVRLVAEMIATGVGWKIDGTAHFQEVKCRWRVSNADLEMFGYLSLFGDRDYFPGEWRFLAGDVGDAIKNARVWQCYTRYVERGRVTADHRKLLNKLIWDAHLFRGDGVSLYVQGKRPFGDSGRALSIAAILGWKPPEEMPVKMVEKAWELFDELRFAVHDALAPSMTPLPSCAGNLLPTRR